MRANCFDFNNAAAQAVHAGLTNVYSCPNDNIAERCNADHPLKQIWEISESDLRFNDIVIYLAFSPKSVHREILIEWWLQFFSPAKEDERLDIVLIGDACDGGDHDCTDFVTDFAKRLSSKHQHVQAHVVRGLEHDKGYGRLACKVVTGMIKVLDLFPSKRYYIKIDDDTVLIPRHLLNFLKTLDASTPQSEPLYFGSLLSDHGNHILCDGHGVDYWNQTSDTITKLCYGQGGAGYGFNNLAFRGFNTTVWNWPCTPDLDLEREDEDAYMAFRFFKEFKAKVVHCGGEWTIFGTVKSVTATVCCGQSHGPMASARTYPVVCWLYNGTILYVYPRGCGVLLQTISNPLVASTGFRPHGGMAEKHFPYAISFHHVHEEWLSYQNTSELLPLYGFH